MQSPALHGTTSRLLTVTGMTGIAYALSWIAGLSIPAPSPPLSASGAEIAAALAGHGSAVAAQFTLTEGLPAGVWPSSRWPWPARRAGPGRPRPPGLPSWRA